MKLLDGEDFLATKLKKRGKRTHTELKRLMTLIDDAARDRGVPPSAVMTQSEAQHCFSYGLVGIDVPRVTPKGRPRDISLSKWQSIMKLLPKKS